MTRLMVVALLGAWVIACEPVGDIGPFPDGGPLDRDWGGEPGGRPDSALSDAGPPFVALNAIQLKGYHRSSWHGFDEERDPEYRGHDRPELGPQLAVEGARIFHFGYSPITAAVTVQAGGVTHWGAQFYRTAEDDGDCEDIQYSVTASQSLCPDALNGCINHVLQGSPRSAPEVGGIANLPTERHAPIFLLIEPQPSMWPDDIRNCFSRQIQVTSGMLPTELLAGLESHALGYFDEPEVFTPNELQGDFANLRDAVTRRGWPGMEQLWGRFVFILYDKGEMREAYREGRGLDWPELGMSADNPHYFVLADDPEDPDAAFFSVPASETEQIRDLVERGFIVHAHSLDADEIEGARRAGAQLLTTLELGDIATNGPAVCNGVAPTDVPCDPRHFEPPSLEGR